MKRSEAVEKIAEHLLGAPMLYGGDEAEREEVRATTKLQRIRYAHYALEAMEELGVLPPEFTRDMVFDGEVVAATSREWEPEDE